MENKPLISIALCTYNGERFIREQIDSILNQTYNNIEIVVVDDCSDDSTVGIIESYGENRIRIYRNSENIGFNKNFEKALGLCSGRYIAISDQDDIWEKDKIRILYENIRQNMLIYSNSLLINEKGETLRKRFKKLMPAKQDPRQFSIRNYAAGHTMLLKKDFLDIVCPIPVNCFYDWWFALNAANIGKIISIDKCLTRQRFHHDNSSAAKTYGRKYQYASMAKWISNVLMIENLKHRIFFEKLYDILSKAYSKNKDFSLLLFQILNFKKIYNFRNIFSNINESRKIILSDIPD